MSEGSREQEDIDFLRKKILRLEFDLNKMRKKRASKDEREMAFLRTLFKGFPHSQSKYMIVLQGIEDRWSDLMKARELAGLNNK